jgi:hypothetical protein
MDFASSKTQISFNDLRYFSSNNLKDKSNKAFIIISLILLSKYPNLPVTDLVSSPNIPQNKHLITVYSGIHSVVPTEHISRINTFVGYALD